MLDIFNFEDLKTALAFHRLAYFALGQSKNDFIDGRRHLPLHHPASITLLSAGGIIGGFFDKLGKILAAARVLGDAFQTFQDGLFLRCVGVRGRRGLLDNALWLLSAYEISLFKFAW